MVGPLPTLGFWRIIMLRSELQFTYLICNINFGFLPYSNTDEAHINRYFSSFGGEIYPLDILQDQTQWHKLDLPAFLERNAKHIREAQAIECAGYYALSTDG
jgi:hypothetical protein